ncbi:MAG: mannose-1-phosphate guanylyltransferase [Deltaproteobacteria bacterium]|nr:MAG: mannose-1-phosphate guanylyltransferase [Deltaproteobacteria bacterium]
MCYDTAVMPQVWTIVMAGGVGSRFWPVSRRARPKQLLDLFGDGPMLRVTVDRVAPIAPLERTLVVTGEVLRDAVREALPGLPPENLLCEPCGRNTAPAVGWAAAVVRRRDPDAILMVLPADQHIADVPAYQATCRRAIAAAAEGAIATLGIPPTRPETGYGYILRGAERAEGVYTVDAFKEKPDAETALAYLADGRYAWNAGMFFMPAALFSDELARFEPELAAALDAMVAAGDDAVADGYPALKKISVDYAVMERSDAVVVVPGSFGWSDVGSWTSLYDHRRPGEGSFHLGDVIERDGTGNVLFAADGGTVAAVGVDDLVVVHTRDATFVCPREAAQRAREVVDVLAARGEEDLL